MTKKITVNGLQFDVTSLDVAPGRALMFEFDASVPVQEIQNAMEMMGRSFSELDYNVPVLMFRQGYCVGRNLTDDQMLELGWMPIQGWHDTPKVGSAPKVDNVVQLVRKEKPKID